MQSRLTVTALETRDNPSAPAGLLDVPRVVPILAPPGMDTSSFVEVHQITKTFTHTMTLDQFGSGSAGTFVLDVTGKAHAEDQVSVTGPIVISGSGTLTSDVEYHLTIGGQYSSGVFTVTSQSYTETGSATANYAYSVQIGNSFPSGDAAITRTWDLSWSGTVTGGALSFTNFSNTESYEATKNWHDENTDGDYFDRALNEGITITATGSGTTGSYTGRDWLDDHSVTFIAEPAPGTHLYDDEAWDIPLSGTGPLSTTPLGYDLAWNALEATAVSYTWHGETVIDGVLEETATWANNVLTVNSFTSNSHLSDEAHLIESDAGPSPGGTGQETYSIDDTRTYVADVVGSGSYVDGVADADYYFSEQATVSTESGYEVTDEHSSGLTEEGEPFDLMFNFYSGYTGGGTYGAEYDYHEDGAGTTLTGSTYHLNEGGDATVETSGVRNGVAFASTNPITESASASFSLPGSTTPISPTELAGAFPLANLDSSAFLIQYGAYGNPPTPTPTAILNGAVGRAPQVWYNYKIRQIGADTGTKVAKLAVQSYVMDHLRTFQDPQGRPTPPPGGTYTRESRGYSFSDAMKMGRQYDRDLEERIALLKKQGYVVVDPLPADVVITYAVDQANQNPRSGKCLVEYKIIFNFRVTRPPQQGGATINVQRDSDRVRGLVEFENEDLKTMSLQP